MACLTTHTNAHVAITHRHRHRHNTHTHTHTRARILLVVAIEERRIHQSHLYLKLTEGGPAALLETPGIN